MKFFSKIVFSLVTITILFSFTENSDRIYKNTWDFQKGEQQKIDANSLAILRPEAEFEVVNQLTLREKVVKSDSVISVFQFDENIIFGSKSLNSSVSFDSANVKYEGEIACKIDAY